MKKLFLSVGLLVLFGASCSRVPPYVAGEVPTDAQLEVMTDEQKEGGIWMMMQKQPPVEPAKDAKEVASNKARQTIMEGVSMKIADFVGLSGRKASGMARIITKDQDRSVVFAEDFSTDPGPSLVVFASNHTNPTTEKEMRDGGSYELGSLFATTGGQGYALPANADISKIRSIVIMSKPFRKIFAVASIN